MLHADDHHPQPADGPAYEAQLAFMLESARAAAAQAESAVAYRAPQLQALQAELAAARHEAERCVSGSHMGWCV